MIQEYEVKAGVILDAAASGGRWGTIVILFVTDEATIKAKSFIGCLKESRVTLSLSLSPSW